MDLNDLKNLIYKDHKLLPPSKRREALTQEMKRLDEQEGKNCFSCSGLCCTYEHNSMQITPLETIEVILDLKKKGKWNSDLIDQLKENIKKFRLDKDLPIGKGRSFRRSYTCPFYLSGSRGCGLSKEDKPFGCLGFNPLEKNVSRSGQCAVNSKLHLLREAIYKKKEDEINQVLVEQLNLYWMKAPIPVAIVDLSKKVGK